MFLQFGKVAEGQKHYKVDGVAPLITDPPPTSFTTLSEEKEKKTQKNMF